MLLIYQKQKSILIKIFIAQLLMSTTLFGLASYTAGGTANELAAKIQGNGVTITNPVIRRGSDNQTGIFTNGATGANLAIDDGIYLGGMSVQNAFTTNSSWNTSNNFPDISPDADLLAIDSRARYDTVVFEFDVTLDSNTRLLLVNYQFASDEYNEYVGSIYNDAFGFFVSGGDLPAGTVYNIARVVDPQVFTDVTTLYNYPPVTVNNVNNGSRGTYDSGQPTDLTNSQYFIDNSVKKPPVDVEFDGLTVGLNATLDNLTPGETYHFKMALADVGDSQWDTGVFVNSIQGIRGPEICYDYAYEQNNRYFTEEYDPTTGPKLAGSVMVNTPVNVQVSIQNQHENEVDAQNVKFSVLEMDPSQVEYESESVYVTNPGSPSPEHVADNTNGMTTTSTDILNIPVDDIKSFEEFFVYYSVNPKKALLDMPLNLKVEYDITLPLSSTQDLTIHLADFIDQETPICTGANFEYTPSWGVFNVEDRAIAGTNKYNLYTQVAKRPFDVDLVAYDKDNIHATKGVNSIVAIELIDAKPYHDVNTSCRDPQSAITPRVWMIVGDGSLFPSAITPIDIGTAISSNMTTATSLDDFYGIARENTAFRISYNVTAGDGSLVKTTYVPKKDVYEIDNYTELVQDYSRCKQPVLKLTGTGYTDVTASVCGNSGTAGLKAWELARCNECLYGYNTVSVCSRDNFSIRPEAFKIEIFDDMQGTSGTSVTLPDVSDIAAGYSYRYDMIATSHTDENPVIGYTQPFLTPLADHNITYVWSPTVNVTGCNDATDQYPKGYLVDGLASNQRNSNPNVGEYSLLMLDKAWTAVDQSPPHHYSSYFDLNDCSIGNSFVPSVNTVLNSTNVGCTISSRHTNKDRGTYADHNVTVHPFKFDLDLVSFYRGVADTVVKDNSFVYMNTLTEDANMSARYDGNVKAVGADNTNLSNFVTDCYAQSVDLTVETSNLPTTPTFRYRLFERDSVGALIRDTNGTSGGLPALAPISVPATSFRGTTSGGAEVILNLNFDRFSNTPVNPVGITYGDLNVSCTTAANCQSYANLSPVYDPKGTKEVDATVIYLYGRANAPRKRVMCSSATAACTGDMTFYYEFYADDTLTVQEKNWITALIPPDKIQRSVDSVNWYRNPEHQATDGGVTATTQSNANITPGIYTTVNGTTNSPFTYSGTRGYPYKSTVWATSGVGIEPWLVYDPYVAVATKMSGQIEYYGPGKWTTTGDLETHSTGETNKAVKTNRRIRW